LNLELLLKNKRISITGSTLIVNLLMGAGYTWLDLLQTPEYITAVLAFVPDLVSLLALRAWQRSTGSSETYLQNRKLSWHSGTGHAPAQPVPGIHVAVHLWWINQLWFSKEPAIVPLV